MCASAVYIHHTLLLVLAAHAIISPVAMTLKCADPTRTCPTLPKWTRTFLPRRSWMWSRRPQQRQVSACYCLRQNFTPGRMHRAKDRERKIATALPKYKNHYFRRSLLNQGLSFALFGGWSDPSGEQNTEHTSRRLHAALRIHL